MVSDDSSVKDTDPTSWADRLTDPDLPGVVAAYFAQWGSPFERATLAGNDALPLDVQLGLANDEDDVVAQSLLGNWEIPTEVIALLLDRFPDLEEANSHPQAPVSCKLRLPIYKLASYNLSLFLDAAKATESERRQLHRIAERFDQSILLGEAWAQVRLRRWPPPRSGEGLD